MDAQHHDAACHGEQGTRDMGELVDDGHTDLRTYLNL